MVCPNLTNDDVSYPVGEEEERGSKGASAASAAAAGGWATAKLLVTLHSNAIEVRIRVRVRVISPRVSASDPPLERDRG